MKPNIFVEICIFGALEIRKKYALYLGKMLIFCIFAMPQKCILMEMVEIRHFVEICIFEALEICKKYAFYLGKNAYFLHKSNASKMHIGGIVMVNCWEMCRIYGEYAKNMHFT